MLTLRYNEPVFILMLRGRVGCLHELLNRLRSTMAVNVLRCVIPVSGVPKNFFRGGVQQIQLRTEERENGDLGAVAP